MKDINKQVINNVNINYGERKNMPSGCCGNSDLRQKNYSGFKQCAENFITHLFMALYPRHIGSCEENVLEEDKIIRETSLAKSSLKTALEYVCGSGLCQLSSDFVLEGFFARIPYVRTLIETDIQAAYEGDPAAKSIDEVILSYPAFEAISAYRFAHELYLLQVPLLPRLITEFAHRRTGIDIHPGANIGGYFFIDHGTGVVIGETTVIGQHVKLYQHVTLGAKSFELGEDGRPIKGIKRHPEIGDYAVIYAGATILGGNTRIGHHSIIGGNVWLTRSVEPYSKVTVQICENQDGN